jgi:hypothetical protein
MTTYEVIPLRGIGPVFLDMSREQVRSAMGMQPRSFKKSFAGSDLADAYHEGGFQVFYDKEDRVEYIELSSLDSSFIAVYKGGLVFHTKASDLVDLISKDTPFDPDDPELGYGYVFPALELSLWRPIKPESDDDLEGQYFSTIGVGRRGYYSRVSRGDIGKG